MWTQRDQMQAYRFLQRRLVSALQKGDANHPVSPAGRVVSGTVFGLIAAMLITAGFAIYGVLRPGGGTDWNKPGKVVIERESGATFVLDRDGRLHPVLNYASARLLAGGDGSASVTVPAKTLANVARGAPLGIVGAPGSLPDPHRLLGGPWSVCTQTPTGSAATTAPDTTVGIGLTASGLAVGAREGLLVSDTGGSRYLVTAGHRLRLRDDQTLVALGYDTAVPVRVSTAWVNSLPAGPDLGLITIPGSGGAGPRIGNLATRTGQVLLSTDLGGTAHYYAVRDGTLAAISQTEAALILGDPANKAAYPQGNPQPVAVSAAEVADSTRVHGTPADSGYPVLVPAAIAAGDRGTACAVTQRTGELTIWLSNGVPVPPGGHAVAVPAGFYARTADATFVPPGGGALVREQQGAGSDLGALYLITDLGLRYQISGADAVKALGYGSVQPVPVPEAWLSLFPAGPVLEVAAASQVVYGGQVAAGR